MMLSKNRKAWVHLPDDDTTFFNIIAGVLLGHTFAPYLLIICLDNVLQMSIDLMKESSFTLKKTKVEAGDILQKL